MFGQSQISTDDGESGKVIYQVGNRSFLVPVNKLPSISTSSPVDKSA